MFEIFDPRKPEINVATARTKTGARLKSWWLNRQPDVWVDYAPEGEGWL